MQDGLASRTSLGKSLLAPLHHARGAAKAEVAGSRALVVSLRTREGWWALWRAARPLLVYAVGYLIAQYASAKLAYAISPRVAGPSPLYMPGGVTVAALLLTSPRRWWLYLLLTFPLILIDAWWLGLLSAPTGWWVILVAYLLSLSISVVIAGLLHRYVGAPLHFASVGEVSGFVLCVALGAVPATAISTAARYYIWSLNFWFSWATGYVGYVLGIVVFTPAILLWATPGRAAMRIPNRRRLVEITAWCGSFVLIGIMAQTVLHGQADLLAFIFLPVPLLLWAAVEFGSRAVASALAVLTLVALIGVLSGRGPFDGLATTASLPLVQLFLAAIGIPLLFLGGLMEERKQTGAALQASEERYRDVVESQSELISRYLPDTTLTFVNEANCRSIGRSREQLLGTKFIDLLPDSERQPVFATIQALVAHPGVSTLEHQVRLADGSLRWQQWVDRTILDGQGHVIEIQGIGRDITERKQMELGREEARAAAERQAEELDRIFEQSAEGLAVYDFAGRLMRANAALHRLLGRDTVPTSHERPPPTERALAYQPHDRDSHPLQASQSLVWRALHGEMISGADALDIHVRAWDGRELDISASATPLRDHDGHIVGAIGIFRDQTERRRLERSNAEQAEQLERVVEAMGEGLLVYDMQGQIVRTNAAARRLLGVAAASGGFSNLSAEERIAPFAQFDQEGDPLASLAWLALRAERDTGVAREGESRDVRLRTRDGRKLEVSASSAALRDPDGQVVGAVLLLSDRTEYNQLAREREEARASELALREVNQRLDTFIVVAAHDLRSPVGVSRMVVQRAQQVLQRATVGVRPGSDEQRMAAIRATQAVETAQRSLDHLWRLVHHLLDAARVQRGILVLQRQPVDLAELVRTSVDEQRLLNPSRVIDLSLPNAAESPADCGAPAVFVDADADRLGQVVTNYLANAVRYSAEDQPIEVTVRLAEDEAAGASQEHASASQKRATPTVAHIEVRDYGVGVSQEDQEFIWDRYQRAKSVAETSGLGLGLYISRTIVELHGGHVGIESTVGQGSMFWFTIPLAPGPASMDARHEPSVDHTVEP